VAQRVRGRLRLEHAEQAQTLMSGVWARRAHFVSYVDARDVTWTDHNYRARAASVVRALEDGQPPFRVCTAIVIRSGVARAALSVLNVLSRSMNPPVVVATPVEAAGVLSRAWGQTRGPLPRALIDGLDAVRRDELDLPRVV
jgi:hypothetical protein